jgi:hypothetical protein
LALGLVSAVSSDKNVVTPNGPNQRARDAWLPNPADARPRASLHSDGSALGLFQSLSFHNTTHQGGWFQPQHLGCLFCFIL